MTSQDRQIRTRTVSLRRARAALISSLACAAICGGLLVLFLGLVTAGASPALLIAPAAGLFFSGLRARTWHRAIRTATTSPDEMRWTP